MVVTSMGALVESIPPGGTVHELRVPSSPTELSPQA